ncbi:hypothetical protein FLA_5890 [Filimonas lacunae]|nr:hypothetical protein FLA_5890 [Filimonas lacunae]
MLAFLFLFRTFYGLCNEFWFEDELQIYLIGLKSFTTHTWPYYGPDVVYTHTQIAGGLQGLLIAAAFCIARLPELPTVLLNVFSFGCIGLLAWYITRRITGVPQWFVWILCCTTPWALFFTTRVTNPSYVMVFAIPFFISILELLPVYEHKLVKPTHAWLITGFCTACIMQLHMSWVLLMPYTAVAWIGAYKKEGGVAALKSGLLYLGGWLAGAITLIPTLLHPDALAGKTISNIMVNTDNISKIVLVLARYLSFASYEIPYMLGAPQERIDTLKALPWMIPFTLVLLVVGFLQVGLFIISFFTVKATEGWKQVKWMMLFTWLMVYVSFLFAIIGPSSHAFYVVMPLPVIYSCYCYQWLISLKPVLVKRMLGGMLALGFVFHLGLGYWNYRQHSLYVNRPLIQKALDRMDYKIAGQRRTDKWGYGY